MKKTRKLFGIQFDNNTFEDLKFIKKKDGKFNRSKAQEIRGGFLKTLPRQLAMVTGLRTL